MGYSCLVGILGKSSGEPSRLSIVDVFVGLIRIGGRMIYVWVYSCEVHVFVAGLIGRILVLLFMEDLMQGS